MARERMITRSISVTVYTVMTVNLDTKAVENVTVSVTSVESKNAKKIAEEIRKGLPNNHAFVQTLSSEKHNRLYGMPESKFIELAEVLPDR